MRSLRLYRLGISLLFLAGNVVIITAQQAPQYGLYMFEPYAYNPAYGGLTNSISISADVRKQWSGLNGAPTTQFVTVHMPLYLLSSGVGIALTNESLGAHTQTGGQLSYNYVINNLGFGLFSIGASLGVMNRRIQGGELRTPEGNYEGGINHNDPIISTGVGSVLFGTVGGGIYFRSNNLDAGVGFYQLLGTTIIEKRHQYKPSNHLIFNAVYFIDITEGWKVAPSMLLKYDYVTLQTDVDLQLYRGNFILGAGVRGYSSKSLDAYKVNISGRLNERTLIGYNYEGTLSGLKSVNDNTHELFLQFRIPSKMLIKPQKIIYHPRM